MDANQIELGLKSHLNAQLKSHLKATYLINHQHPEVLKIHNQLLAGRQSVTQSEYAKLAFYYVRDTIKYRVTAEYSTPQYLKASETIKRRYGHCVSKAIVLTALLRKQQIPCRLHFVDLKNHRMSANWMKTWGEKLLWHGYVEILQDGKWIAANPAFDVELCLKNDYIPVEFDGENDALFSKYDIHGNNFMEYQKDHGTFDGVPYFRMAVVWLWYYGPMMIRNKRALKRKN